LVAAAKLLVAATKNLFVVPNFVAVTKAFFFVGPLVKGCRLRKLKCHALATDESSRPNKSDETNRRAITYINRAGTEKGVKTLRPCRANTAASTNGKETCNCQHPPLPNGVII